MHHFIDNVFLPNMCGQFSEPAESGVIWNEKSLKFNFNHSQASISHGCMYFLFHSRSLKRQSNKWLKI